MTTTNSSPSYVLSQIDAICDAFEAELKAGRAPRIEVFLENSTVERRRLLRELLLLECAYGRIAGRAPVHDVYAARFPQDLDLIGEAIEASRYQARSSDAQSTTSPGTVRNENEAANFDAMPVRIGMTIGNYRVSSLIGSGGMGSVFLATHTLIDLRVALKVMQPRLLTNSAARQRFLQEAQAAILLHHPNIVLTRDVGEDSGLLFLTMEILDGCNLSDYVKRTGPMPAERVLAVMEQVTAGLGYAHQHGIVHRDVKPHNLMQLNDDVGTIKILDLGLARLIHEAVDERRESGAEVRDTAGFDESRLTGTGSVMGTLAYMAPEQATNAQSADERSDVFSLGCTAYYLLAGRAPFEFTGAERRDGEFQSLHDARTAVQSRQIVPLESTCPAAPPALVRIINRMMALDPAARYATMSDVAADLQSVRRRLYTLGWKPDADDAAGLRNVLSATNLVDGEVLARTSARKLRATMTGDESADSSGEDAFELLRLLERLPNGGLSQFQVEQILTGRIDRLRFPRHVVLDRVNTGWKGDVFRTRRTEPMNDASSNRGTAAEGVGRLESVRIIPVERLRGLGATLDERVSGLEAYARRLYSVPQSPLVARLYDVELQGNAVVAAMELVEGRPLSSHVSNVGPITTDLQMKRSLALMLEMCRGLQHLHAADVLHLDLSPDRWIVRSDGRAVLIDWGLADMLISARTEERPAGGSSPPIVPPEMVGRWSRRSAAADVFALGQVYRFLRTGQFPFRSNKTIVESEPPPGIQSGSYDWVPLVAQEDTPKSNDDGCSTSAISAAETQSAATVGAGGTEPGETAPMPRLDRLCRRMTAKSAAGRPTLLEVEVELNDIQNSFDRGGAWSWLLKATGIRKRS